MYSLASSKTRPSESRESPDNSKFSYGLSNPDSILLSTLSEVSATLRITDTKSSKPIP